jgi:peroxiredoxin Q/BCP
MLKENTKAPDFKLLGSDNKFHTLQDFKGKWLVVYFFPKDNSPNCIKEAIHFSSNINKFKYNNTEIIGISGDSIFNHQIFINDYDLSFILLSDPTREVIRKYDAGGIITRRISYLIDPSGIIRKTYPSVDPARHAEEILNDLIDLKNNI